MNFSAAALRLMADKGLTLLDVAEIVAANDVRADPTANERQRRCRANKSAKGHAVTVTRDPSPNERDNLTPTREGKTEPEGSSKSLVEDEKREAVASCLKAAFVLPDDIPAEQWEAWIEMRRRLRKSPTDNAKTLAVTELRRLRDEEGWPPGDVLNHCTMNSYQGIYPPPTRKRNGTGKSATAYAMLNPGEEPF